MLPPGFYNQVDKDIYAAGDFFIPQERFRAAPYTVSKPSAPDEVPAGIPAIYQSQVGGGGGGGFDPYNTDMNNIRQDYNAFPSRQAGEIYSGTFNPQPYGTGVESAQAAYNQANQALAQGMDPNSQGYGSFTGGTLTGLKDIANEIIMNNKEQYGAQGQYVDPYDPRYSSVTEAQKFMDNYPEYYGVPSGVPEPGIPGAIKSYMENSLLGKGFGMAKDFLGRVMPINERAIMENEARGAGIFTDDIGRIVTDDYNTAGGIMAGYNLNQIDEGSFSKRRDTIEKTIADKKAKGLDTTTLEERLSLLDDAEENILGARKKTQQIYKMRLDKKAADKKRKEEEKAAAAAAAAAAKAAKAAAAEKRAFQERVAREADTAARARARNQAVYESADRQGFTNRDGGFSTSRADRAGTSEGSGQFSPSSSRGRSGYMSGGLADMLEIYD